MKLGRNHFRAKLGNSFVKVVIGNAVVAVSAPVFTVAPVVSGLATAGATLTRTLGTAAGATLSGQWVKNGTPTGITTSTYAATVDGDEVYWAGVATNSAGTAAASSNVVSVTAAADTTAPSITTSTLAATGTTTATGTITTSEAGGTIYALISTNQTAPNAATVKASGASQAGGTAGVKTFNFIGLTESTLYSVYFVHTDAAGNDSAVASASDTTDAVSSGTASITATWKDRSPSEEGYRVRYRTAGSGGYTLAVTTAANVETAAITGLDYGTNYDVTVAAFNSSGEYSQVGPVTRYTPPEFAPTGLTASSTLGASITVGFAAAAGVTSYQGYYRATGSSTWLVGPAISTGTSINFTGLASLTSYQLMVRGYLENTAPQTPSYSPDSNTLTASTAQGWNTARSIVDTGETIVETAGTLVIAENFGEAVNRVVNGVTFTGVTSKGNMGSAYVTSDFFTDNSLPAGFTGMMRSLIYTEAEAQGQFTLTGLISGDAYLLQVFSSDNRTTLGDRSQTINVASLTSAANVINTRYAMTCRFIASATSHVVSIDDPANATGANHIQAYQLRKL